MYNYKIVDYPNGTIQIRYYSKPVVSEREIEEFENCCITSFDELKPDNHVLSDEAIKRIEAIKEREKEIEERDKMLAKMYWDKSNANRAKNKVYEYSRSYDWDYFVTWTFSSDYVDRFNYDECSNKLRKWLNNQKRASPDLKYIVVPEQHKNGAWHFHGLIADCDGMNIIDSGHKTKDGNIIYNISGYNFGFTTATKVKDVWRVSKYIGKYITKSLVDNTSGKQRYFVSNNLPKPLESKVYCDNNICDLEMFISNFCEERNMKMTFSKCVSSQFRDISYIELEYRS